MKTVLPAFTDEMFSLISLFLRYTLRLLTREHRSKICGSIVRMFTVLLLIFAITEFLSSRKCLSLIDFFISDVAIFYSVGHHTNGKRRCKADTQIYQVVVVITNHGRKVFGGDTFLLSLSSSNLFTLHIIRTTLVEQPIPHD